MPPPVSSDPYRLQPGYDDLVVRQTADYPINHHRRRTGQLPRRVWPWLALLGLTIVVALASTVVAADRQPVDDSVGVVESVEVALDDPESTSTATSPDGESGDVGTTLVIAVPGAVDGDPYERYLQLVDDWDIADAPKLTRDDALARAVLGCSSEWPAGSIDAALADAYSDFLQPYRDRGRCE